MTMLLTIFMFSPAIVALVTMGIILLIRRTKALKGLGFLVAMTLGLGILAVAISLAGTIAWMEWYETTKGYSAGNAIVGWVFFLAPSSFTVGQVAAFILWFYRYGNLRK